MYALVGPQVLLTASAKTEMLVMAHPDHDEIAMMITDCMIVRGVVMARHHIMLSLNFLLKNITVPTPVLLWLSSN